MEQQPLPSSRELPPSYASGTGGFRPDTGSTTFRPVTSQLYDHVLDAAELVGAVPGRYRPAEAGYQRSTATSPWHEAARWVVSR